MFSGLQIDSLTSYHFRLGGVRWLFAHQGWIADMARQDYQPQNSGSFTGSSNIKTGVRPGFEPLGRPRKSVTVYNQLLLLVYRVFGPWRWILRIQTKLPKNGLRRHRNWILKQKAQSGRNLQNLLIQRVLATVKNH